MKLSKLIIIAIVLWSAIKCAALSAEQPSIVGTWELTSFSVQYSDTNEIRRPYDNVTGYLQYSPGGHMVVFITRGDLRQPETMTNYTDAERSNIHKGIIGAYCGTYRIQGNVVTHHILTAWFPHWIGSDQIRYFEIDGKALTIKTAPLKSTNASQRDFVAILTWVRVE